MTMTVSPRPNPRPNLPGGLLSLTQATPLGLPQATLDLSMIESDLAALTFAHHLADRGFVHLVVRDLPSSHTEQNLPTPHQLLLAVDHDSRLDHVVLTDGVLLWLDSWANGGRLRAAGPDAAATLAVADAVLTQLDPETGPDAVRVEFADRQLGSRQLELAISPWADIAHLYPASVANAMSKLVDYEPADGDPRLLLWHGRPGTGKTTAIRSLLDAWREWTEPVVINDPESLLTDGRYLRRILLDADDENWRLVVIEDADALLQARGGGPVVSTLLNLADGLLGQGLKCLFLLTTNQFLDAVHPALLRPGRCLSLLEFGPLSAAEAAAIKGEPVAGPMTLAEVMCRDVGAVQVPSDLGGYL